MLYVFQPIGIHLMRLTSFVVLLTCLFSSSFYCTAGSKITVDLNINGLSDTRLRTVAKNKAIAQAMNDLPTVIWGNQNISNGHYSEEIKAIGFAQADIKILNETFQRQTNSYILEAEVFWDEEKIMHVLAQVTKGEQAKKTLTQLKRLTDSASLDKYIQSNGKAVVSPLIEATLLVNPMYYSETFAELQVRHLSAVSDLVRVRVDRLIEIAGSVRMTLLKADSQYFHYTFSKPETRSDLVFTSDIIKDFYLENRIYINSLSGELCIFSNTALGVIHMPELMKDEGFSYTMKFLIDEIIPEQREYLFSDQIKPLEVVICDDVTLENTKGFSRTFYRENLVLNRSK